MIYVLWQIPFQRNPLPKEGLINSTRTFPMITHKILADDAITIVKPTGPLSEEDFTELTETVDKYLESHDSLKGLLIHTKQFPGWEDFEGLIGHIKFVRDHHQKIKKVALVTDSSMASMAPKLANHFVSAEVKSFEYDRIDDALTWLRSD
jgi:hypothetical protein